MKRYILLFLPLGLEAHMTEVFFYMIPLFVVLVIVGFLLLRWLYKAVLLWKKNNFRFFD